METPPSTGTPVPEGDSRNQFTVQTGIGTRAKTQARNEQLNDPHEQLHKSESDLHTSCIMHGALNLEK